MNRSNSPPTIAHERDALNRLAEAIDEYYTAMDEGHVPDRERLLAKYSDVATELAGCLASLDFVASIGPQLADDRSRGSANQDEDGPPADQAGHALPSIRSRETLGDFRLLREIGRGGMGIVFEAEQLSLGRKIALKVLPFAATLDRQRLKRFQNESRAAASLDHPNIVAVHSVGEERGVYYYAMQLVDGKSLAETITELRDSRDGKTAASSAHECASGTEKDNEASELPSPQADIDTLAIAQSTVRSKSRAAYYRRVAELGIQAANALDHAHSVGIVHRDIKPANLLIDSEGKLWITDFGLARVEQDIGVTMTGDVIGTLAYMSPEQALAKRVVIDHRTDIYSLGVTLYEMLTLSLPYIGSDQQELFKKIAFDEPRRPRQLDARIPADLETVVLKAIEKSPTDRYSTALDLAEDLRRFLANQPIRAKRPKLHERAVKWSCRHQGLIWTTLVASIGVLILLGVSVAVIENSRRDVVAQRETAEREKRDAQHQRSVAMRQRNVARRNQYYAEIVSAQADLEKRNLTGVQERLLKHLPLGDIPDNRGWEWYYLMSRCRREERTIRPAKTWDPDGTYYSCAVWSPDGTLIGAPGSVWDARNGECVGSFVPSLIARYTATWCPDGRRLAWGKASDDSAFYTWNRDSKDIHRWAGHDDSLRSVVWSPDGNRLASSSLDNTIKIWNADSGDKIRTISTEQVPSALSWSPDGALLASYLSWIGMICIWDPMTGERVASVQADQVNGSVSWHPDGLRLAACTQHGWYLIDRPDWSVRREYKYTNKKGWYGSQRSGAITWNPDGTQFAVAAGVSIAVWDADGDRQLQAIDGHLRDVASLSWSPDGRHLVSSDSSGAIKVWDLARQGPSPLMVPVDSRIKSIAWADRTTLVATTMDDQSQLFYDATNGSLARRKATTIAGAFQLSPDQRLAAVPASDQTEITIIDVGSGQTRSYLPLRLRPRFETCRFSHDAATLAVEVTDQDQVFLEFWDVDAEQRISSWKRQRSVNHITWDPSGTRVAVSGGGDAGDDGSQYWMPHVHIIDGPTGRRTQKHQLAVDGDISSLAWSDDGRSLAAATTAGRIEVIDVALGRHEFSVRISDTPLSSVAWSPAGDLLACATNDGVVQLVSRKGQMSLLRFTLADKDGGQLAWSPDGKRLAAATHCGTIHLWDATRGYDFSAGATRSGELAWTYYDRALSLAGKARRLALMRSLAYAPDALAYWEFRGSMFAQLGEHNRAAEEFTKAIGKQLRYSVSAALDRAYCLYASHEFDQYDDACNAMVTEFSDNPVPSNRARVAELIVFLAPEHWTHSQQVLELTNFRANQEDRTDQGTVVHAAAHYRHGQFDRADTILSAFITKLGEGGDLWDRYYLACAHYFSAMARQKMGHDFQAARSLREANVIANQVRLMCASWKQQVVLDALQDEAAEVCEGLKP
ncbi:MAG: protein kinase [Planctomycetales bacterium]|nr:protein kinase [Planctomycetales bacterium]